MQITESIIHSPLLGNERRVWLQVPPDDQATAAICILLDGEYYVEGMDAPAVIDELQRSRRVPPFAVAYVSHVDHATRSEGINVQQPIRPLRCRRTGSVGETSTAVPPLKTCRRSWAA